MPVRATKRGAERTRFASDAACDVLICGASFAGLAVARELRASGARVLVLDRYEIGERQTSACAAPTEWLLNLGLDGLDPADVLARCSCTRRERTARWPLPWTFSTFDYRTLCGLLWEQSGDATFETAKVDGRTGSVVHTDRGDVRARADRRRARLAARARRRRERPAAGRRRSRAGWRCIPHGRGADLELWLDRRYVCPGYGWSFPARDELRIGVGSFDPRLHVKDPTLHAGGRRGRRRGALPGQLDPAPAAAGDRGRRVLRRRLGRPLPAADRRGDPHRAVLRRSPAGASCARCSTGARTSAAALRRYDEFSARPQLPVRVHVRRAAVGAAAARAADGRARARVRAPARVALGVPALPRHRAAVGGAAGAAESAVARGPPRSAGGLGAALRERRGRGEAYRLAVGPTTCRMPVASDHKPPRRPPPPSQRS